MKQNAFKKYTSCLAIAILTTACCIAQSYSLSSPNNKIAVNISTGDDIRYSVSYNGNPVLLPTPVSLELTNGIILGKEPTITGVQRQTVNKTLKPLYGISSTIAENYNELSINTKNNFSLVFRAYNEGVAYRFVTRMKDSLLIKRERSNFQFPENAQAYFHPSLSEANYRLQKISDTLHPNYSSLPLLVKMNSGLNALLHESDLLQYPCMSVKSVQNNTLEGEQRLYPKKWKQGGYSDYNLVVLEEEPYIAKTAGSRSFPWRLIAFAENDKDILTNQLTYLLASERDNRQDWSWVKPGKVAWDWWNSWSLTGVPFQSGINTLTFKYFIDFAAANGIEYVVLDEKWSDPFNLLKPSKGVDIEELVRYAKMKKVGLLLWCVWNTLDKQMDEVLDKYQKWGIPGLKVDFIDREDQLVVDFVERVLKETAKRKMIVDIHGAFHPTGLQRTYPNLINVEAVRGLEWNKFNKDGTSPGHDVSIPFIRMFAGSMDYTPGAMQNYNQADWKQIFDRPQSQGTRCHQLAMYIVYYAPLQMLSDAPTAYEADKKVLQFLSEVPTVWDETIPLDGKTGEYVVVARRKGKTWYIGGMGNWDKREVIIDLSFLPAKNYTGTLYQDGANAGRIGNDYRIEQKQFSPSDKVKISMASGGGFVLVLK